MHIEDIIDPICTEWARLGTAVHEQVLRLFEDPTAEYFAELQEDGLLNSNALKGARPFFQYMADFDVEGAVDILEEIDKFLEGGSG